MKENLNIGHLLKEINHFSAMRSWDQFHSIKNLAMALSVESSELLEIYQWLSEEESNNLSNTLVMGKAREEVADIFIYLLKIADKLNIDLEDAVLLKLKQNDIKYPVDKARGNSKKYDEIE